MSLIGKTWFPFFKGSDPAVSEVQAIEAINRMVKESGVRIISIETIYQPKWHGFYKVPVGLQVWHEGS